MPKKDKKKDDKKANERQNKSREEDERKEKEERKKKYTEMAKQFKQSCTTILNKKLPKELEALEKEQIGIVQLLQNEIDMFLKKGEKKQRQQTVLLAKHQVNINFLSRLSHHLIMMVRAQLPTIHPVTDKMEEINGMLRKCTKKEHRLEANTLQNDLQSHQSQVKKLTLEKKEALTRLSELAGRKLLDNNPNIADLSTEIRPTKIGENFMQVYDNEWTDAFEELAQNGQDDKQCIDTLLKILKEAFEHTEIKAKNFEAKMISIISSCAVDQKKDKTEETVTREEMGLIRQLKKVSAKRTKTSIQDEFVKEKTWIKWQKSKIFAEKCVEMGWYMAIQTPPMILMFDMKHMHPFEEKYYKKYMTSGDRFDFLVWPCTLLHKDGPIVAKGIAEATTADAAQTESPVPASNDTKQDKQKSVSASASKHEKRCRKDNTTAEEFSQSVKKTGTGVTKSKVQVCPMETLLQVIPIRIKKVR